jgi:nucleoside-diphosphate-sugar epimerase
MGKDIFITGASGFLGRNLLRAFADTSDDHFFLLVRSPQAERLIGHHLSGIEESRFSFVRGDITEPVCGVLDTHRHRLGQSVREVWHVAASTSFDATKGAEITAANIGGTRNVLTLCQDFRRLERFFHISTAYVCGTEQGSIPEGPFTRPRQFKNPYEETKYDGETMVRASGLPFVVIRPSIVVGDSRTGDAGGDSRMLYGYLLALYNAALHHFGGSDTFAERFCQGGDTHASLDVRLPGDPDVTRNVVTADDVLSLCLGIRGCAGSGQTFNVVNPRNIRGETITDCAQRALNINGFRLVPTLRRADLRRDHGVEKAAYRFTRPFWPYMRVPEPIWETANADTIRVPRVVMDEDLFAFLLRRYVEAEIIGKRNANAVHT